MSRAGPEERGREDGLEPRRVRRWARKNMRGAAEL